MNQKPIQIPQFLTDEPAEREAIVAEGCGLLKYEAQKRPDNTDARPKPRK